MAERDRGLAGRRWVERNGGVFENWLNEEKRKRDFGMFFFND